MIFISYLNQDNYPRGLRNNNPGNIRVGNSAWNGKIPLINNTDYHGSVTNVVKAFEQFTELRYGLRALMKIIYNYYHRHGLTTVTDIITRYAPHFENNTMSYINIVSNMVGLAPYELFELTKEKLILIAKAIVYVENGNDFDDYVTDKDYADAYSILGIELPSEKKK